LVVIVPAALVVGAYGVVRVWTEAREAREAERHQASIAASAVRIAVEDALETRGGGDVQRLATELVRAHSEIGRIAVVDRRVTPLAVEPPGTLNDERARELERAMSGNRSLEHADTTEMVRYVLPLHRRDGRVEGALEIAFLTREREASLGGIARDVGVRLGVLMIALGGFIALALRRQILRPLHRLTDSIRALGEGRPGPLLPVERRDELGDVAMAFNRMVVQLEGARGALAAETEHALGLERQLRRAEVLAVAGKLTSALAHEVGTPLSIISGRAELALREMAPGHPARDEVVTILDQAERISGIIRSLLDAVRVQQPDVRAVSLSPLIRQIERLMSHDASGRGIVLESRVPDTLPPVAADSGQLQQVLLNLMVNALDATPAGGRVTVEGTSRDEAGRSGVAIAVSDTGSGIPPEHRSRIFDPFFTTKPAGRGTGLGLAICRDIVRGHGGTLAVQAGTERGATFTVWLPAHEQPR